MSTPPEPDWSPERQGPTPPGLQPEPYGSMPPAGQPDLHRPPYQPPPGYADPYGYPAYPVARPTNGMAIASLVLGILWIYWLGSILALIFGYVARQQIRERGEGGDGMAIAGIVLGWIGVGVLALLLVILAIAAASGGLR